MDQIKWIKYVGPEGPYPGDIGDVTEYGTDDSPLFMVEWPDGTVSVESKIDEDIFWTEV